MNAVVPRATIDQIDASRARCLDLFGQAWDMVDAASRAASAAVPKGVYELPGLGTRNDFRSGTRADFIETVRKPLDRSIWDYLIQATSLDRLMDRKAKDEFREQIAKDPPPATADNCIATMEALLGDSALIFKRGIANAFSGLDRRFRSHDGFKVGARMVLTYFADGNGYVSSNGRRDTLLDVERTFYVLDSKPQPEAAGGIIGALALAKPPGWSAASYQGESDYFRVKVFKNGNAHVWFLRDDLVERVNLLLADYYGAALGASPDVADRKHEANRTPAKNHGFFESPPPVVERLLEVAGCYNVVGRTADDRWPVLTVLEPSAGRGAIAAAVAERGHQVTCIEIQQANVVELGQRGYPAIWGDFFNHSPGALGRFDLVIMNPPFDGGRDIDHVVHALQFVKPGGKLVSVMSAGVEFREDRKTSDFRALVERYGGSFRDLPPGSFADSGTMVNTCIVSISVRA